MRFTFEQLSDDVRDGADVEVENDIYEHVEELDEHVDDDGRSVAHIYKRKSDGKFFIVVLYWCRYGYENYEFEEYFNDGELDEVVSKEITIRKWVRV